MGPIEDSKLWALVSRLSDRELLRLVDNTECNALSRELANRLERYVLFGAAGETRQTNLEVRRARARTRRAQRKAGIQQRTIPQTALDLLPKVGDEMLSRDLSASIVHHANTSAQAASNAVARLIDLGYFEAIGRGRARTIRRVKAWIN